MSVAERISHIQMECTDMARSCAYYRDLLGLRVTAEAPAESATLETPAGQRLTLHQVPQLSPRALAVSQAPRGPHLAFYVAPGAWRAVIAHLEANGIPWADRDHAQGRARGEAGAYINDPDGYTVQLITTGLDE